MYFWMKNYFRLTFLSLQINQIDWDTLHPTCGVFWINVLFDNVSGRYFHLLWSTHFDRSWLWGPKKIGTHLIKDCFEIADGWNKYWQKHHHVGDFLRTALVKTSLTWAEIWLIFQKTDNLAVQTVNSSLGAHLQRFVCLPCCLKTSAGLYDTVDICTYSSRGSHSSCPLMPFQTGVFHWVRNLFLLKCNISMIYEGVFVLGLGLAAVRQEPNL